MQLHNTNS